MTSLVQNRNYRLLFSASAFSNLGDGIAALAFPWLATLVTRDPFLVALVAMAGKLPWFLFAIPAGIITDRANRHKLLVRADLIRFVLNLGLVFLLLTLPAMPPSDPGMLIITLSVLAFLLGSAEVIRDNTAQTALPSVVPDHQLERANGHLWSIEQIMGQFIGPPLAGLLIALAVPAPFGFDALMFAASAGLIWLLVLPAQKPVPAQSPWADLREALSWLWAHKTVLQLALMLGCINFLFALIVTTLPLFSQDILGLGALGYGFLLTAEAVGGVLGGWLGPSLTARLGQRRSLTLALGSWPLCLGIVALSSNPIIIGAALMVSMFAGVAWNVVTVSYRQRLIPGQMLGRVNALYRFLGWGVIPIGALSAGLIASLTDPALGREAALRLPFIIAAIGSGLLWIYGVFRLRF